MPAPVVEPENATTEPNFGQLLESTLNHAKELLQAEIALARHELSSQLSSALSAVVLLVAGVVFLQAALTTLGVLLVLQLGGGALAASVVAGLTVIGAVLCLLAKRSLDRRKLPRTADHLALDARQAWETIND